ncbi:hypothetical protein ACIQXF_11360 [Lysinibacillus sp. NPDC097231]|uniref:hypothetical protein n=1 Tax=Lysinibacillus sp. NPDC097231 TaxID=3364142 RepID=UPI003801E3B0
MLSHVQIDALLKQNSKYRPASQEEKELFFDKLEQQYPKSDELVSILNNREQLQICVDMSNPTNYRFQLEHSEGSYRLTNSFFAMLE